MNNFLKICYQVASLIGGVAGCYGIMLFYFAVLNGCERDAAVAVITITVNVLCVCFWQYFIRGIVTQELANASTSFAALVIVEKTPEIRNITTEEPPSDATDWKQLLAELG